jgi:diaminopimelate decarboxylase
MFDAKFTGRLSQMQTPLYYYDLAVLDRTLKLIKEESEKYGFIVHYALKANDNPDILRVINDYGFGADCVSGNEIKRALECGFTGDSIVFAGVGKSDQEIIAGLDAGIHAFNCESLQEIEVINNIAGSRGLTANIALRINPNVNAFTHKFITTGLEENKFGINPWEFEEVIRLLKKSNNIRLNGFHFHIGSQITDLNAFRTLCVRVNEIVDWFARHEIIVQHLNVGGGLGVDYHQPDVFPPADFTTYFALFDELIEKPQGQKLHFELGRALVAQCGSLISKVLYVKKGINTNFIILDAGMTELLRPALYQAYHKIENLTGAGRTTYLRYDVVGPICESSDCFGKSVMLPETFRGDLFAIRTTGAYGEVMSSKYNLRDKAPVIFSTGTW